MTRQIRQYGTWASPISPKSLAGALRLNDVQWDTASDYLVWHEGRGALGTLVAQCFPQAPRDLTTGETNVRASVGYGGGDFTVSHGHVYFAGPNGRLYKQSLDSGTARPITPAFGEAAAPRVSPDGKWLVYVHTYEHTDGLALVDTEGQQWPRKLAYGTDFVMQPAWHPDGKRIAYIAWNHPLMPWDGTELRLVTLDYDGERIPRATSNEIIAGNETTAIFQPEFSPDGRYLAYVSDQTGWGQLYVYDLKEQTHVALTREEAEHGAPAWIQGVRTYGWMGDSKSIVFLRNERGFYSLWRYDLHSSAASRQHDLDHYTEMSQVAVSPRHNTVALIASASRIPARIISYAIETARIPPVLAADPGASSSIQVIVDDGDTETIHRRSSAENIPQSQLAEAQAITWTGHDGESVHGLYYPPTSERFEGTGKPPLIVYVHGGPTSQVAAGCVPTAQFFATRGFAVLAPNYRGSTGYGKAYMNKLRGSWGIYDVEDCASGATHLAEQGLADSSKLVILGGSAGGFTVLQSLVEKPGFYKAGVCLYGVANQFGLAVDTHKFEERYLDSMLGPLPEAADVYRARSPLFHADRIVDPIIVFQGADDKVVPKSQSDAVVASLKARGIPHEYHVYEGEGHGWRKPETIEHYYNAVMRFLTQYVVYA
jgi:dipeptidyl aminopeptidase/acylaminoacyl peptidase